MIYFPCTNERTDLEAVLVGLQDGVDLRGCEDVALEGRGGVVTSRLEVAWPAAGGGPPRGGTVTDGVEQALVLLAW